MRGRCFDCGVDDDYGLDVLNAGRRFDYGADVSTMGWTFRLWGGCFDYGWTIWLWGGHFDCGADVLTDIGMDISTMGWALRLWDGHFDCGMDVSTAGCIWTLGWTFQLRGCAYQWGTGICWALPYSVLWMNHHYSTM